MKDEKVWIEQDGIEYGIANDLMQAGIPAEDILMALFNPNPISVSELQAV
ncbi:MAG: element excision factor XisI family protein [Aridibacter sp.]